MLISVIQLGTVDYATGLRLQSELIAARKEDRIPDTLLLLEHKPVITLGRNAKQQNIVVSRELLQEKGVELFETDRGGDVTFHGPGQLVGYPIFDLHGFPSTGGTTLKFLGAVDYVRKLEEVLIRTALEYGVPTKRIKGLTGVWTDWNQQESVGAGAPAPATGAQSRLEASKLAAIGVHISRSVTSHGFALNVNTDLDYFKLIVPCGIADKPVTSLEKELAHSPLSRDKKAPPLEDLSQQVARNFGRVFEAQTLWLESLDALLSMSEHDTIPANQDTPARAPEEIRRLTGEKDTFIV